MSTPTQNQAAEDLAHREWSGSQPYSEWNPRGYKVKEEPMWTMRDGTKIKVSKMETSHINNCIRMLERSIVDPYEWGEPQGEAARDAFMQEARQIEQRNRALMHNINIFKSELVKRSNHE